MACKNYGLGCLTNFDTDHSISFRIYAIFRRLKRIRVLEPVFKFKCPQYYFNASGMDKFQPGQY